MYMYIYICLKSHANVRSLSPERHPKTTQFIRSENFPEHLREGRWIHHNLRYLRYLRYLRCLRCLWCLLYLARSDRQVMLLWRPGQKGDDWPMTQHIEHETCRICSKKLDPYGSVSWPENTAWIPISYRLVIRTLRNCGWILRGCMKYTALYIIYIYIIYIYISYSHVISHYIPLYPIKIHNDSEWDSILSPYSHMIGYIFLYIYIYKNIISHYITLTITTSPWITNCQKTGKFKMRSSKKGLS